MSITTRVLYSALTCLLLSATAFGQSTDDGGHRIAVNIAGFDQSEAYLANYFMDKQYIVDTAVASEGKFVFEGEEKLPEGTYLIVLPPDNDFAQVQLDADQHFSLTTNNGALLANMEVAGSDENQLFYDYMHFIQSVRPAADSLRKVQQDSTLSQPVRDAARTEGEAIDELVERRQEKIMSEAPGTLTAALLRSQREPGLPEFAGTPEEQQNKRYRYYKSHFFDDVDLGDPRGLRSPFMANKVTYYMEKLVPPVPDTINRELDYLLGMMRPAPETFKFYTSKFLNDYAGSKIVGMDAVYVHLAENYYMSGEADWADTATVSKIAENVGKLKPLLIGQPAPSLVVQGRDKKAIDLYEVDAAYTVLFFFDPDCGVCKKQTPGVIEFATNYADKGVKVVSVCSKFAPDDSKCWDYVDSKQGMAENMLNAADPYHKSKYKVRWDIASTPQVYVLDKDKKIVSKRIGGDQLPEVLDRLLGMDKRS